MRRPQVLITAGCVLALAAPATALAGGSAGDQQYTDPFGSSTTAPAATTASTTTTATTAASASTATSPTQTATVPTNTSPSTVTSPPTGVATAPARANGSSPTTGAAAPAELPFTGYDDWLVGGAGGALLAGGLVLRRRTRPAGR